MNPSTFFRYLRTFLKDIFNIHEDKEVDRVTIAEISKNVEFKGANLWILIFAIFIASIGLNVNSTAVVIGAMLISPLMGPIMGVGLGAGINDFELIKKSLRNLGVAVFMSILASTIYFLITPISDASSELLARTTPTIWDVLIALFGGFAGIIAGSRKEKSNAIPGVAIATALMPPLCTAGYGLATANWYYFLGAMYLFSINCIFISISTIVVVRFLKYRKKEFVDAVREKRVKTYISIFIFLFIIPSIWLATNVVRKSFMEQNANKFVAEELNFENAKVISKRLYVEENPQRLEVILFGEPVDTVTIRERRKRLANYSLSNIKLVIRQGYQKEDDGVNMETIEQMNNQLKAGIIEDLYKKNEELLEDKNQKIRLLEDEVYQLKSKIIPLDDISAELKASYPNVKEFTMGNSVLEYLDTFKKDTLTIAYVNFKKRPSSSERKRLENWLKARSKAKALKLIVY
ncbi:MAG: TIGR00341 family protein [Cyclobacteriaceae bacterium]